MRIDPGAGAGDDLSALENWSAWADAGADTITVEEGVLMSWVRGPEESAKIDGNIIDSSKTAIAEIIKTVIPMSQKLKIAHDEAKIALWYWVDSVHDEANLKSKQFRVMRPRNFQAALKHISAFATARLDREKEREGRRQTRLQATRADLEMFYTRVTKTPMCLDTSGPGVLRVADRRELNEINAEIYAFLLRAVLKVVRRMVYVGITVFSYKQCQQALAIFLRSTSLQTPQLAPAVGDCPIDFPPELCDPITLEVLRDPVKTAMGQVYERASIERWLADHTTDPLTNVSMTDLTLTPHPAILKDIETFRAAANSPSSE